LDEHATQIGEELAGMIDHAAETVEPDQPADAADEPEEQAVGGLVTVQVNAIAANRWRVAFLRRGTKAILHRDTGDLNSANTRDRMIQAVITRLGPEGAGDQPLEAQLEQHLMQAAAASEGSSDAEATPVVGAVDYEAVIDEDNPEATGFYACGE
jgi:hypothetical protein